MARSDRIDVGASSAHRWTVCTASPKFIFDNAALLPDDSTRYADEGTQAHEVAALILDGKGVQPGTSPEMLAHVETYVSHVRSHYHGNVLRRLVEKRIPLFYLESRSGIVDSAVHRSDALFIDDLKYGIGVSVEAEGNKQLAIYAESLIREWEIVEALPADFPIHLSIVQPRDRNNPVAVRTWSLSRHELAAFTNAIGEKAKIAIAGEGQFQPHPDACKFCPATGICSAYANEALVALPAEIRPIELPDPGVLSREQRVQVLKAKRVIEDWLDAVMVQEVSDLMDGAEPTGFKLVEGRSTRQWADPAAAQKLLARHLKLDQMKPRPDLLSPAAAEKALKGVKLSTRFKNAISRLITRPEGKPTLAPVDDPRPAIETSKTDNLRKLEDHE